MFVLVSLLEQNRQIGGPVRPPTALRREIVDGLNSAEHIMLIDLADRRFDDMRHLMFQMLDRLATPADHIVQGQATDGTDIQPTVTRGRATEITPRERQVLNLSAEGHSYESIGDALQISVNTVRYHMKRLHMKLKVSNRVAAIHRARELGIV